MAGFFGFRWRLPPKTNMRFGDVASAPIRQESAMMNEAVAKVKAGPTSLDGGAAVSPTKTT